MGNQPCKQCKYKTIQTQAYGAHQIISQDGHYYAVIQKKLQKDNILQAKVIEQLEIRQNLSSNHIVKLQKYTIHQQQYGFKTTMYYEYVPKTLRDRMEQLKIKKLNFTQRQIFAVIYGVQAGLEELTQNKIKHCCINLDTILVKNTSYKITDVSSTTYITSYDLANRGNREQFLSQILLQKLSHQSLHPVYSLKDDLFSLGLIALTLGSNRNPSDFYIWSNTGIASLNIRNIEHSLKYMERKFSSKLMKKIKQLLYGKEKETNQKSTKQNNIDKQLIQLDEQIDRVLYKAASLNSTTAISPQVSISRIYL